mmetsp:Transcript_3168/g.6745  ORF Transcript_3168/g.6745 Transcript_3168/m.6745 type:complete len:288 (-) Transcript_3168:23-886(-)
MAGETIVREAGGIGGKKRKADSSPPEGYVCRLCSIPGHWIQVCPTKKTGDKKRQKKTDHVPVPGKDPSPEDIEEARKMQQIPPPKCFCGLAARLNRIKRSKEGGDGSRAIGKYFFFCSKKRDDETQCRFARPAELEMSKEKVGARGRKKADGRGGGSDEKVDEKCNNSKQICKFFVKGSCKKGKKCEFSHEIVDHKKRLDQKNGNIEDSKKVDDEKSLKQTETSEDISSDSSSDDSSSSDDNSTSSHESNTGANKSARSANDDDENEDSDDSSIDSNDSDSENDEVY